MQRIAWAALLAWLVLVPATSVWVDASGHDYARVLQIALCLLSAASLAARASAPTRSVGMPAAALLALALASTFLAPDLRMASRELTLSTGLVAVTLVTTEAVASRGATALLAAVSVAGAAYAGLVALGLTAALAAADHLRPLDLFIGYTNGRFFNHVQTSMLPLLAIATAHSFANRWFNRLAGFGLAVGIALLLLSEGRATGLALVVGCGVGAGLFRAAAWPIIRSFATACGWAAIVYLVCFIALPRIVGMSVDVLHVDGVGDMGSAQARFFLWRIALAGIARAPWLGIGPMHFSHTRNSEAAHPHNVYLQVADEWGVPMALLLLGVALVGLRRLYKALQARRGEAVDRTVGVGLFITAVAIGVDGMLSGNFVMPVSQVWIAVVIGAAIGWVRRHGETAKQGVPAVANTALNHAMRLLPLLAMLWLTASVAPELGTHLLDRPAGPGPSIDAGAPRFWANGWF